MPLPDANQVWPPLSEQPAHQLYDRYGAWYCGDPEELTRVYATTAGLGSPADPSSQLPRGQVLAPRFTSAIARGVQRLFWGAPAIPGQVRSHKVHIPLAGDIASTSADLLFGKAPVIKLPGAPRHSSTQARLDEILDVGNFEAVLLEAGETAAAYGGAYIRVVWDPIIATSPLFDVLPPDCAIPEWRGNRLVAVTFHRVLNTPDGRTWRHLERHEPGRILHGLYVSTDPGKLGRRVPLTQQPETAPFAMLVDPGDGMTIETGAEWLAAEYLPNIRPNRALRGSPLGRSDYAGVEQLLDALDEAWTSWMRDLRLGKGRIVVPRSYLMNTGRGNGAYWDAEREVYEAVDALGGDGALQLQVVQFQIRVAEHQQTVEGLITEILRSAGYSAQTFGEQGDIAQTATEISARDAASYRTRNKKLLHVKGPLIRIALAAMQIDAAKFGTAGMTPEPPTIEWPDPVPVDPQAQATTLQLLGAAEAASIRTRVAMLHPDWDDVDIDAEVARIKDDAAAAVPMMPEPGSTLPHGAPDPGNDPNPGNSGPGGNTGQRPAEQTPAGQPAA